MVIAGVAWELLVLCDAQRPGFSEQSTLPGEVLWYPRRPKECSASAKPQPHLAPLGCTSSLQPRTSLSDHPGKDKWLLHAPLKLAGEGKEYWAGPREEHVRKGVL